ncbi:MAG: beta-L-arabinofuranosidase domain-containing protein [Eubacteriales bacterium]
MEPKKLKSLNLPGITGNLSKSIENKWLIGLRQSNPAILDMFAERDKMPYRDLLPWSGEFAGKYITGAHGIYKLTGSKALYDYIMGFIGEMLNYQDDDGYIGCFSKKCRLTGAFSQNPDQSGGTWDCWAHYHIMVGLILWYTETGMEKYFDAVKKIAELFMHTFYTGKLTILATGWSEMNMAPYHIFARLYNMTRDKRYLDFALAIEGELSSPGAGNYINHTLNGLEYYQCPKPRWESMHIIMGIAEMYRCTGDKKYLTVAEGIYHSILKTDVHNTGAFSTNEAAVGSPFASGSIETCCVIAYNALAVEIFKLTGDPGIADFLELSLYNTVMGSFSSTGHWSTYDTPMEGVRSASAHSINFQCRPGSPELNCCSVNAPRGIGMLSDWMITEHEGVTYLNFYENFSCETDDLKINISGSYPLSGDIKIALAANKPMRIALRIPAWSKNTGLTVNGIPAETVPGTYHYINIDGRTDIDLSLDFSPRLLAGDEQYKGKSSIYYGPVLYGCDVSTCGCDFTSLPAIPFKELYENRPKLWTDGSYHISLPCGITLRNFYKLGSTGCEYKTWLIIKE